MSDTTAIHASAEVKDGNVYLNLRALDGAGMTVGLTPDEAMELVNMLYTATGAALGAVPGEDYDDEAGAA